VALSAGPGPRLLPAQAPGQQDDEIVGNRAAREILRTLHARAMDDGPELPAIDLGRLMDAGSVFVTKYGPRAGLVGAQHLSALTSDTLALAATCPVPSDVAARVPLDCVVEAYRLRESNPHGRALVMPQWHAEHGGSLSP
jgi:hypothetical protein